MTMSAIDIIKGILIYMYGQDHNPPHLQSKMEENGQSRLVEGKGSSKTINIINEYIDKHEVELLALWEKAQRGETIEKIKH